MKESARTLAVLALVSFWACSPAPRSNPPQTAAPAAAAPAQPPAPAKRYKMVCRNSRDGRAVACGTPNAVMVGVKPD